MKATIRANSNLALIKYWGNKDPYWNIPTNDSISVSLDALKSTTKLEFGDDYKDDFILNDKLLTGEGKDRIDFVLAKFREFSRFDTPIHAESENNFPTAAGIASSASGFGALAHALYEASGLAYTNDDVSRLARLGSGSAARTIHPGYAHWFAGENHETSYAKQIKPPDDLKIIVAITEKSAKPVSSFEAMELSKTQSPFFVEKAIQSKDNIEPMLTALKENDFSTLGQIAQKEANNLHAVINTTGLGIPYWNARTLELMQFVNALRENENIEAYYTIDAGPQVKILCKPESVKPIVNRLQNLEVAQDIILSGVGNGSQVM
ncbi:MAG: diphosphomevalonate decarboxylase [Candidatus Heimdallarchaeota archaeon]|nr:diphosphomevalonate decarboxylase [Candidatus Heimdallarchaeota archaeon]